MTVLIVSNDHALADAQALGGQLQTAGHTVLATVSCHILVREVIRLAPQTVVAWGAGLDSEMMAALTLLASSAARPVVVAGATGPPGDAAALASLVDLQVMAWLPVDAPPAALLAALALAGPRFAQSQAQVRALATALAQLDERKWVDRAKGVLMRHQQLSEDDAFSLLRSASMQANLRVGEVSRGVIEAAQSAEAVNLAGQLRMLSQRCVRALALRAASPGHARADEGLGLALQRLAANLQRLAALQPPAEVADILANTHRAWLALLQLAGPAGGASDGGEGNQGSGKPVARRSARTAGAGPSPQAQTPFTTVTLATLTEADQRAETLLDLAEQLTTALEAASGRRNLRVVNLCGRQRMLSQRLAKQALLASLLPEPEAARHAAAAALTIREFEATMVALEQAPLASDAIRAALAQSRGQWQRLLDGLRRSAGPDAAAGRAALARESDALLAGFEQLTTLYEHSIQVLMG